MAEVGSLKAAGDFDACTDDTCDSDSGDCVHLDIDCDDGEPCSIDSCDPEVGCQHDCNGTPDDCECMADLNDSGGVGAFDLAMLLGSWGPCPGCPADLDCDGDVGADDLARLLGSWGPCL